ncbi:MAG: PHB depolymerase family esterase [Alphaproteobacteria bacterium]
MRRRVGEDMRLLKSGRPLFAIIAAVACIAAASRQNEAANHPGDYHFAIAFDGIERQYDLHVPKSYSADKPAPLIVALHGGGGDADIMSNDEYYGLISKSEAAGFIIAFPNGFSRFGGMFATWNAGKCCGRARDKKVDDVGFIKSVVQRISTQANVDSHRVFAIGMSNGGMMAYRLACDAPEVFHGIMSVAGTDNTNECHSSRPVAILHIHARDDDKVLFNGGAGNVFRRNKAIVNDFVSVNDTIAKWVALDHAEAAPRRVLSVDGAVCDLHVAQTGGAPVELCVTDIGGHSWPGGKRKPRRDASTPSQAINADDVMWNFFSSLPGN